VSAATAVEIRPLQGDEEWAEALRLQQLVATKKYLAGHPPFKVRQMAAFRSLCQAGLGEWWGAWMAEGPDQGRLVADMGLFFDSRGNSCLQQVETHPGFRRRGIGKQLLHQVTRRAFGRNGVRRLVIQAEADSPGDAFYARMGGRVVERTIELTKVLQKGRK
jgi:GNAT superfamily N-acetyltransferase